MLDDAQKLDPGLRVISDTFMSQLEELMALEERKRTTPVDDPSFPDVARQVETAARALLDRASQQTSAAQDVHDTAVEAGATATIEDIPADLSPARVLALWRDADRELASAEHGSVRWYELRTRVDAYRRAYQAAYDRRD